MNPIWRVLYQLYRALSTLRHWTRRRFTPLGVVILGALCIAGMLSPDTDNNIAYQALTLLTALVLVAVFFALFFHGRFSATRLLPPFGTVGCPLYYRVVVKNLTRKPQDSLTLLEDLEDSRATFLEWRAAQLGAGQQLRSILFSQHRRLNPFRVATVKPATLTPAAPHGEAEARIELTPLRRGLLRFEGVSVASPDPLGLFRAFVRVPLPQTTLILPRRYPVPPLTLPGATKYQDGGVALAANVGQSDEFVALRDYRRGDPLRHIHWRSWARTGKPVIKEFEDEFFVRHALVLDTFAGPSHALAFEEAVSVAASFASSIQTQESLLDLLFVGPQSYCFTAGRSLAHTDQMLRILASVRACSDEPFSALQHLVLNHIKRVSGCICVLLSWDEDRREFIRRLRALGVPLLVFVIVPPGWTDPVPPGPMQDEPGQFHVLEAGHIEEGLAKLR